jgi:aspartate kinase
MLPPMIVYKRGQVLITLQTIDFSFVEGKPTTFLYDILKELNVRPNLTQNTAISLMLCIDDIPGQTEKISLAASEIFEVQVQKGLTLLTIRHYTQEIIDRLSKNAQIILEQKTRETVQLILENGKIK